MFARRYSSSTGVVGIDFSHTGLHMLQVREQGGGLHVVGAARNCFNASETPPGSETLTEYIRSAFTTGGFAGRRCVVSLPPWCIMVQSLRMPSMPDPELRQAVTWEASQRFGFERDELQVDYIRTGAAIQAKEDKEEYLLVAASNSAINEWVNPVVEAGMRPVALECGFTALARTLSRNCRRESDRDLVRVVVHVGCASSTVMILRGNQIAFCKIIDIGGNNLTSSVADHLQLEPEAAADLREARCRQSSDIARSDAATDRAVFEAVRPLMGDLVKEVVLCLRYYGVTFRGQQPNRVILTGRDGQEPHLAEMMARACKLPVDSDTTPPVLAPLIGPIRDVTGARTSVPADWAIAGGLSMRGWDHLRQRRKVDGTPAARSEAA